MTLAASGVLSTMASRAKTTLAQCSAFQTWTGTADAAAAALRIAEYEKRWTEAAVAAGRDVRAMVSVSLARPVRNTGVWGCLLTYHFEAPVSAEYVESPEEAFREFQNHFGATIEEMRADSVADITGALLALRFDEAEIQGPYMTPEADQASDDLVMWAELRVPAGPKG